MARFVFFSFAYEDVKNFKVNVVRNSWLMRHSNETFVDGSIWEKLKTQEDHAIKQLIESGLKKTSITTVLIGESTANRKCINYEIIKSFERGNGILGIHINRIKGKIGITPRGINPLDKLGFEISEDGERIHFYELLNRKWTIYKELPTINNKKSNTLYFADWLIFNDFGKFFRFSEKFDTYCWIMDDGNSNFSNWIEEVANEAGR